MEIFVEGGFESAHFLPNVPDDHKCRRLHGHSFRIRVTVEGAVDAEMGWVADFADVKAAVRAVTGLLDHRLLNDIEGLENPTSEVVASWLWQRLELDLPSLAELEVRETCTSGCRLRAPR